MNRSQPKLRGGQSPPLVSAGPGQWGAHAHGHPDYRFRYTEPLSSKRRSLGWGKHCAPDRVFANLQGASGAARTAASSRRSWEESLRHGSIPALP